MKCAKKRSQKEKIMRGERSGIRKEEKENREQWKREDEMGLLVRRVMEANIVKTVEGV